MINFTYVQLKHSFPLFDFGLPLDCLYEQRLQPEDAEYRKDDNGSQTLYKIGEDSPFGDGKIAFVVDNYPNGKKHFQEVF